MMRRYKVKLMMVRSVEVEVEASDDAHEIDIEDEAAALYYRGGVDFPQGSPSLKIEVLHEVRPSVTDKIIKLAGEEGLPVVNLNITAHSPDDMRGLPVAEDK